ncbi:MAG: acyl carrier protein [Myxococcota bacterium]|nr:acyl carrier protein [Myxococcota bacterium]
MDVRDAVVAYVRDEFRIDECELTWDAPLVRTGLLDSVSLVQLAGYLERTFGIEIPDQEVDADHLDSIGMIVEYVRQRLAQA